MPYDFSLCALRGFQCGARHQSQNKAKKKPKQSQNKAKIKQEQGPLAALLDPTGRDRRGWTPALGRLIHDGLLDQ